MGCFLRIIDIIIKLEVIAMRRDESGLISSSRLHHCDKHASMCLHSYTARSADESLTIFTYNQQRLRRFGTIHCLALWHVFLFGRSRSFWPMAPKLKPTLDTDLTNHGVYYHGGPKR